MSLAGTSAAEERACKLLRTCGRPHGLDQPACWAVVMKKGLQGHAFMQFLLLQMAAPTCIHQKCLVLLCEPNMISQGALSRCHPLALGGLASSASAGLIATCWANEGFAPPATCIRSVDGYSGLGCGGGVGRGQLRPCYYPSTSTLTFVCGRQPFVRSTTRLIRPWRCCSWLTGHDGLDVRGLFVVDVGRMGLLGRRMGLLGRRMGLLGRCDAKLQRQHVKGLAALWFSQHPGLDSLLEAVRIHRDLSASSNVQ